MERKHDLFFDRFHIGGGITSYKIRGIALYQRSVAFSIEEAPSIGEYNTQYRVISFDGRIVPITLLPEHQ